MKPRLMFLSVITASVLLSLSAGVANAQMRNPTQQEVAHAKSTGPCQDPWISIALTYKRLGNYMTGNTPSSYIAGIGNYGECNAALYNGGSWSSFDELSRAVQTSLNNMSGNVRITMSSLGNNQVKITTDAGSGFVGYDTIKLIGHDSGSLINHDGASVIAQGGGNFHVQSLPNEKRVSLGKSVLIIRKK